LVYMDDNFSFFRPNFLRGRKRRKIAEE